MEAALLVALIWGPLLKPAVLLSGALEIVHSSLRKMSAGSLVLVSL
jgi:hypothetical protein